MLKNWHIVKENDIIVFKTSKTQEEGKHKNVTKRRIY